MIFSLVMGATTWMMESCNDGVVWVGAVIIMVDDGTLLGQCTGYKDGPFSLSINVQSTRLTWYCKNMVRAYVNYTHNLIRAQ
jgi:hypothetical protein